MGIIGTSIFTYLSDVQKLQKKLHLPKQNRQTARGPDLPKLTSTLIRSQTFKVQDRVGHYQWSSREMGQIATRMIELGKQPKPRGSRSFRSVLMDSKGIRLTV